jgi:peptidoglycan/xylan/chitin deacetylase (PgdA/CDA1 family)
VSRLATALRRRLDPPAVVLVYHRVSALGDAQLLNVSPERFRRQLEHIASQYRPAHLRDLFVGRNRRGTVAVTFDDGYLDNLTVAKPLLEATGVPATVFVSAGGLGEEQLSDTVERCLLGPDAPPPTLTLSIGGQERTWQTTGEPIEGWNVTGGSDPTPRHAAYREVQSLIRPLPAAERTQALDALKRWAGGPTAPRDERRLMVERELVELVEGGTVEVGSHGVNHLILALQTEVDQREELVSSKHLLEEILARPVPTFAYPYGGAIDVSDLTTRLAQEAGYELACVNAAGVVTSKADRYRVPRVLIGDWDEREFAEHLAAAF